MVDDLGSIAAIKRVEKHYGIRISNSNVATSLSKVQIHWLEVFHLTHVGANREG
jgi:hypothetical protein